VDQPVARDRDVARVLDPDRHAGRAGRVGDQVVGEIETAAVHHEDADHTAQHLVAGDAVVVAVHEVQPVARAVDAVAGDRVALRVPDHEVAAVEDLVPRSGSHGSPQPDRIAAEPGRRIAVALDPVADDADARRRSTRIPNIAWITVTPSTRVSFAVSRTAPSS